MKHVEKFVLKIAELKKQKYQFSLKTKDIIQYSSFPISILSIGAGLENSNNA